MYLGVDIGGTKTFVAALDNDGVIKQQLRFPTPKEYKNFILGLAKNIDKLTTQKFIAGGIGLPATEIDRDKGVGLVFSNLPWRNVTMRSDVKKIIDAPVVIENDAKLAGLSEAMLVKDRYQKVLYVTISTGIGTSLIVNQTIDTSMGDAGGATIMLEHEGNMVSWESFASGSAILRKYGKQIEDIDDAKVLDSIAYDIAEGLIDVIAFTEPEVVIIGGGAGRYLPKFAKPLNKYLKRFENPIMAIPPIQEAGRPSEAVVYGCYDLAKATYGPR